MLCQLVFGCDLEGCPTPAPSHLRVLTAAVYGKALPPGAVAALYGAWLMLLVLASHRMHLFNHHDYVQHPLLLHIPCDTDLGGRRDVSETELTRSGARLGEGSP